MKKILIFARAAAVPAYLLAAAAIFAYALYRDPFSDPRVTCPINGLFHVRCLTCGATRAAYCLAKGQFGRAFYYNALFTVGFIPAFLLGLAVSVNFAAGRRAVPLPKFRLVYFWIALGVMAAFVAVRNLVPQIY